MNGDADTLRTVLDVMRSLSKAILRQQRFGSHAGDLLLMCAVAIGHLEAKPMGASQLSRYVGMARPTVIRRLRAMERAGLVVRDGYARYSLTPKALRRIEATGRR